METEPSRIRMVPEEAGAGGHDRRWLALAVLCLSLVLIVLDNTVLNVALPTLVRDLGASTTQLQWIVDAYVIVFAGLLLTAGALGDRFGRRRALQFGLVVFALASALAALSGSSGELVGAREVMGFGAAFVMPATLSIISPTPPSGPGRSPCGRGWPASAWPSVRWSAATSSATSGGDRSS